MDPRVESEDASNDTTMISELLKSAEVIQQSHQINGPSSSSIDKSDRDEESQLQIIDKDGKHMVLAPPPLTAMEPNTSSVMMINQDFFEAEDSSKLQQMRHVHIPYILNGELYQIQTQDGENVTVKCCHCPPDRVYRGSVRSTGNFHMHIKRRHPDLLEKLHNMKVNALLERRDRLMRSRKVSSRNHHRNRQSCSSGNSFILPRAATNVEAVLKDEAKLSSMNALDDQLPVTSSTPELSLMHTHKLKIKTVFQRHQMQQREAAEMRDWNNSHYDMRPPKLSSYEAGCREEPINYSVKSQEKLETHSSNSEALQEQHQQSNNIRSSASATYKGSVHASVADQQPPRGNTNNEHVYENQQLSIRDISTTSSQSTTSSPSVLSTYSSHSPVNNTQYICNMDTMRQHERPTIQNTLSIVKPEHLLISTEEQQAIDLSMHTDSGIFSNCDESVNISQNVTAITNEQRAGSRHMLTPQTGSGRGGVGIGGGGVGSSASKWQELLMHVETSLRDIQHEMNIRNQIESNRMFLDIAKFKFLHPGFQFNW